MLSVGAGLFLEDELEVVGAEHESEILRRHKYPSPRSLDDGKFVDLHKTKLTPTTCPR